MTTATAQQTLFQFVNQTVQILPPELTESRQIRPLSEVKREFHKTIQQLSYSRHTWQVWQDWNEATAIALANWMYCSEELEKQYLKIVDRYAPEEVQLFPKLLALTTEALEAEYCDFLGQMFMELELGSKWHGQFFTPYHLCKAIAMLTVNVDDFSDGRVVTINEPAAGGGAMVIALCEYLREQGINFQEQLRVVAQDVDQTAVHMCYIQLSLIGCPAVVIWGDTIKMESKRAWKTPMAILQRWFA